MAPHLRPLVGALVGATLLFAACGDDTDSTATTALTESTTAPAAATIEGAWARTSPMMATMGAAYMTITSPAADRLVAASVDPSIAGSVEIHEVVPADQAEDAMDHDSMGSTDATAAPAMVMQQIDGLDLPAGTTVELKPGGYHIMLVDLAAPLEVGTTIAITLTFEQAGELVVDVPVRDEAP